MTVQEYLDFAREKIPTYHGDFLGAEVLLSFVLGKNRDYLVTHPEAILTSEQESVLRELFVRFLKGEPVAYLTGEKEFYGLNFYVDKRVLIPRPETEMLVEEVIAFVSNLKKDAWYNNRPLRIIDVGTGSGCIAISLAKHLPLENFTAGDISSEALQVAKNNAKRHEVYNRINFQVSDLLENISGDFDIIVANLPYIGVEKFNFVSRATREYEPHVALFGGEDGLVLYKKLFQQIVDRRFKPLLVLGEFGFLQVDFVRQILNTYFAQSQCVIKEDLAHIERIFLVKN